MAIFPIANKSTDQPRSVSRPHFGNGWFAPCVIGLAMSLGGAIAVLIIDYRLRPAGTWRTTAKVPIGQPTMAAVTDSGAVIAVNPYTAGVVHDFSAAGRLLKPITMPETKQNLLRRESSP